MATRTIGRFNNAELVGQGGFGAVYRAFDPEHGRDVAIKILSGMLGEKERRRFDRERQTMGRLGGHPNIMPVYESGYTDAGEPFLVMEYASGGSLGERLDSGHRFSWQQALDITVAIAKATQAAHDQGVLHRDIKPDNILIDAYDNPRLADFGIAAVTSSPTATTTTTATLAHAAPELLEGMPETEAVDVYALGSVFYTLIVGSPPFVNSPTDGANAVMARTLTQPPPDLAAYGVPASVEAVAKRSMAKHPTDRPSSASDLAAELTAAVSNQMTVPIHDVAEDATVIESMASLIDALPNVEATAPMHTPPAPVHAPPAAMHAPSAPVSAVQPKRRSRLPLFSAALVLAVCGLGSYLIVSGKGPFSFNQPSENSQSVTSSPSDTSIPTSNPQATTATTGEPPTQANTVPGSDICPHFVFRGETSKHNIYVCTDGSGDLIYHGNVRNSTDSITLDACHLGGLVFRATNVDTNYFVDTVQLNIRVVGPNGELLNTSISEISSNYSLPMNKCDP